MQISLFAMHAELPDLCRCLVCCTVALFYIQFNKNYCQNHAIICISLLINEITIFRIFACV